MIYFRTVHGNDGKMVDRPGSSRSRGMGSINGCFFRKPKKANWVTGAPIGQAKNLENFISDFHVTAKLSDWS